MSENKPGRPIGGNKVITRLLNDGPLTAEELPRLPNQHERRNDGVRKFRPTTSSPGDVNLGNRSKAVYWLEGKHQPETVIKKWMAVVQPSGPDKAIHYAISDYGEAFREASGKILGPFPRDIDGSTNPDGLNGGTCPLCEEEYPRSLRDHLPCDGVG